MSRILAAITAVLFLSGPLSAQCAGENILKTMPAAELADLRAEAAQVPYPTGNLWRARRGGEVITLVGTYHYDDPRHDATIATLEPFIETAATVLVEAGPEAEQALIDRMATDPSVMLITEGPTLIDRMPPDLWAKLSNAMAERGIPGFMAAKMQPWYATVMIAIPPCAMAEMTSPRGLDGMVTERAAHHGIPVKSLEPYDTVLRVFGAISEEEQLAMIETTLATEDRAEDFTITLADSYFAGESRLIWELMRKTARDVPGYTPERADREFALMEELLMSGRNRTWIPVLTEAAKAGPVLAAFGALHLSGKEGVLALLEAEGFTIEPLPL